MTTEIFDKQIRSARDHIAEHRMLAQCWEKILIELEEDREKYLNREKVLNIREDLIKSPHREEGVLPPAKAAPPGKQKKTRAAKPPSIAPLELNHKGQINHSEASWRARLNQFRERELSFKIKDFFPKAISGVLCKKFNQWIKSDPDYTILGPVIEGKYRGFVFQYQDKKEKIQDKKEKIQVQSNDALTERWKAKIRPYLERESDFTVKDVFSSVNGDMLKRFVDWIDRHPHYKVVRTFKNGKIQKYEFVYVAEKNVQKLPLQSKPLSMFPVKGAPARPIRNIKAENDVITKTEEDFN